MAISEPKKHGEPAYETLCEVWHTATGPASVGKRILDYVRVYQTLHGVSPAIDEIKDALGISTGDVVYWLEKLERQGKIRRERRTTRSIVLCDAAPLVKAEVAS